MSRTTRFQILVVLELPTFDLNFATLMAMDKLMVGDKWNWLDLCGSLKLGQLFRVLFRLPQGSLSQL